jgi:hypothetical protein
MKYAVEMVSCAMIYIPSFIKIGLNIQRWMTEYTETQTASCKLTLIFSEIWSIGY